MQNDKTVFGNNVRKHRIDQNLSQEALGALAGLQQPAVGKIERGVSNTTIQNMSKLSGALGVEMSELFYAAQPDTLRAYLPDLNLEQLPEQKKQLTLTLLKLISAITNKEINQENYDILYEQICKAVRFTRYEQAETVQLMEGKLVYGIQATEYIMGKTSRTAMILDISSDLDAVNKLIDKMNHSFLSIEHFKGVVEDFLANGYTLL